MGRAFDPTARHLLGGQEWEISPVFVTQLGFHIVKLTGRKPAEPKPFEEVKDIVRLGIIEAHRDKKFNEFVDELKKTAKIVDTDSVEEGDGCGH